MKQKTIIFLINFLFIIILSSCDNKQIIEENLIKESDVFF